MAGGGGAAAAGGGGGGATGDVNAERLETTEKRGNGKLRSLLPQNG